YGSHSASIRGPRRRLPASTHRHVRDCAVGPAAPCTRSRPGSPRCEAPLLRSVGEPLLFRLGAEGVRALRVSGAIVCLADRRVVALMASVSTAPVHSFSIGFDEASHDESRFAEEVARRFGTRHTQLTVRPGVWGHVEHIVRQFDEPFADASAIPTYCLSQLTRNYVTVALSGDGGDELFAGYDRYRHFFRKRALYRIPGVIRRVTAGVVSAIMPQGT